MNKPFLWYLAKIDRVAAWTLLATMFLYFISGYGMTKGLINNTLAINLHNHWLPLILITSFSAHTCYAIHLALKRWRIWNQFTKILLFTVYVIFVGFFVYLNSFSAGFKTKNSSTMNSNQTPTPQTTQNSTVTNPTFFTLEQVGAHNKSSDCWIVLSRNVYNITDYMHSGPQSHIFCGKDNTTALSSAHGSRYSDYFSQYKVGVLRK
jgi:hypothetical protein